MRGLVNKRAVLGVAVVVLLGGVVFGIYQAGAHFGSTATSQESNNSPITAVSTPFAPSQSTLRTTDIQRLVFTYLLNNVTVSNSGLAACENAPSGLTFITTWRPDAQNWLVSTPVDCAFIVDDQTPVSLVEEVEMQEGAVLALAIGQHLIGGNGDGFDLF